MSVATTLRNALNLIGSPDRWAQGILEGLDEHGRANRHCAIGAVLKTKYTRVIVVDPMIQGEVAALFEALPAIAKVPPTVHFMTWGAHPDDLIYHSQWNAVVMYNNTHPYEDVRQLFETAIARQETIERMAEPVEVSEPVFLDEIPGAAMEEADRVYQQEVDCE